LTFGVRFASWDNYELNNIERLIEGFKLPKVIPIEDAQKMLVGITIIKHKTALSTIYVLTFQKRK